MLGSHDKEMIVDIWCEVIPAYVWSAFYVRRSALVVARLAREENACR
jgi:hypothetical protein